MNNNNFNNNNSSWNSNNDPWRNNNKNFGSSNNNTVFPKRNGLSDNSFKSDDPNDDGTLSCLGLDISAETKQFNYPEVTQQNLVNLEFYVIDFIPNIKTKYGEGRYLVKVKNNLNDPDEDSRKFFTNSKEIKLILEKLREIDKLPRKVTMRRNQNRYYFE